GFLITTTSCFNNMKQLDNGVRFDPKADSLFAIKPDRSICCQQLFWHGTSDILGTIAEFRFLLAGNARTTLCSFRFKLGVLRVYSGLRTPGREE
ncbi:MAG: hypothetical protein ACRER2_07145, partial [Methylococcales bacterium]